VSRLPSLAEHLVLAAQAVSPDVRLAGGAGLALLLDHRRSDDLDIFCAAAEDVELIARTVEAEAQARGALLARVRTGPTFIRFGGQGEGAPIRVDVNDGRAGVRMRLLSRRIRVPRLGPGRAYCREVRRERLY
jgi:hypothetical protein